MQKLKPSLMALLALAPPAYAQPVETGDSGIAFGHIQPARTARSPTKVSSLRLADRE